MCLPIITDLPFITFFNKTMILPPFLPLKTKDHLFLNYLVNWLIFKKCLYTLKKSLGQSQFDSTAMEYSAISMLKCP